MNDIIVRHCVPDANPLRTGRLTLGTLYYYRRIEDAKRQDKGEGTFSFRFNFPEPIEVDRDWYLDLLNPFPTPRDPYVSDVRYTRIREERGSSDQKLLVNSEFEVDVDFHNCFILCASVCDSEDNISQLFSDAEDYWYFPKSRSSEMLEIILDKLCDSVSYSLIDMPNFWPLRVIQPNAHISMMCRGDTVSYSRKPVEIRSQFDFDGAKMRDMLSDCPFVKPSNYAHEKEFRFAFAMVADGQAVPIIDEPITIDMSGLPSYVKAK